MRGVGRIPPVGAGLAGYPLERRRRLGRRVWPKAKPCPPTHPSASSVRSRTRSTWPCWNGGVATRRVQPQPERCVQYSGWTNVYWTSLFPFCCPRFGRQNRREPWVKHSEICQHGTV